MTQRDFAFRGRSFRFDFGDGLARIIILEPACGHVFAVKNEKAPLDEWDWDETSASNRCKRCTP
jgi:hypothetical protein